MHRLNPTRLGAARPLTSALPLVAAALAAAALASPGCAPAAADEVRTLSRSLSAGGVASLRLEVSVGEVRIEGGSGEQITAEVTLSCDDGRRGCRQAAEKVRLESETHGGRARLVVTGWPDPGDRGLELEMLVRLPRRLGVSLKLGVGEFHAADLGDDLDLEVGVGEVHLDLDESAVKVVKISVGVGEANLVVDGHRIEGSGFLGRNVDWKAGSGTARVSVDCGVGEVTVKLE